MSKDIYAMKRPPGYNGPTHCRAVIRLPGEGGGTIGTNYLGYPTGSENPLLQLLVFVEREIRQRNHGTKNCVVNI